MSSPTSGTAPGPTTWSTGSAASSSSSPEPARRVGRDGELRLRFERRGAATILTERRFRLPLQALAPMSLEPGGAAALLLLNPTGGVLAGDVLETRVELDAEAHACLSTPSATRVYRGEMPAVQRFSATLGPRAVLEWLPDHAIPSPGARLRQSTEIALAPGATVLLADAWATGRLARGETWGWDALDSALTVRDHRGLLLRERCVLDGAGLGGLGGTEGFGYVGTFVALRAGDACWTELADAVAGDLVLAGPEARAGVTALGRGGLLARLLCPSAPVLDALVQAIWARCRERLLGLPPLALRKL